MTDAIGTRILGLKDYHSEEFRNFILLFEKSKTATAEDAVLKTFSQFRNYVSPTGALPGEENRLSNLRLQGFATRRGRPPRAALPCAAVAWKKTCAGRVRSAAPGARGYARESKLHLAHARQKCAAIQSCRKSRNERRRRYEVARGGREIVIRRMRSATAGCPRD